MAKKITLLGSTGSIGTQSLDVVRAEGFEIFGLSAHSHVDLLLAQIEEFHPRAVCVTDPAAAQKLDAALAGRAGAPLLLRGPEGLRELAAMQGPDVVLNSVVGIAGLGASLAAIESGHDLALANKESLVTGGHLVTQAVEQHGVKLLPVDSEHSAIFQCLQDAESAKSLTKILLTASGGPFFGMKAGELKDKKKEDALRHPNWNMGAKITIDSAPDEQGPGADRSGVAVRPAAGKDPDRGPAAEHYPLGGAVQRPFHPGPDGGAGYAHPHPVRPDLAPAGRAGGPRTGLCRPQGADLRRGRRGDLPLPGRLQKGHCQGGLGPCAANGANEEAVKLFLQDKIGFLDIGRLVEAVVDSDSFGGSYTLPDVYECDRMARAFVHAHL